MSGTWEDKNSNNWILQPIKNVGWATAHEEGASGQPAIEKEMDLWNNREGRIIASNNPNADDSQLSNKVVEALNNGVLRKIVDDTLVPTP